MASYYVDPREDDGDGSIGSPWNNIAGHTGSLAAGDTLYLRGSVGSYLVYTESAEIAISANGSSGNPITIATYGDEEVELRSSDTNGYIFNITGDWVVIDGNDNLYLNRNNQGAEIVAMAGDHITLRDLEMANVHGGWADAAIWNTGDYNSCYGVTVHNCYKADDSDCGGFYNFGSNHFLAQDCVAYDMYGDGGGADHAGVSGGDYQFINCTFYSTLGNASENGLDFKMNLDSVGPIIVRGCHFWGFNSCDGTEGGSGDLQGAAINMHFEVESFLVENCTFHNCTQGMYINTSVGSGTIRNNVFYNFNDATEDPAADAVGSLRILYYPGPGLEIYNNVFYHFPENGLVFESYSVATIRNNIFCDCGAPAGGDGEYITADHNCWYSCDGTISGAGDVTSDPLFTNAGGGDFTLQATSPCIDAGVNVGLDYEGGAPDMGAYEYVDGTGVEYRSKDTQGGSEGSSVVHSAPSGLADDDILVLFLYKENAGAVSYPSGFTQVAAIAASDTSFYLYVAWKRAASESGTYTVSWTGSVWRYSTLVAYSGAVASGDPNDATPTTVASGAQNNAITCPSITTVTDGALVIPFGANYDYALDFTAALTGYTVREHERVCAVADATKATAGATGTLTFTHTQGSSQTAGITVALRPAGGTVEKGLAGAVEPGGALARQVSRALAGAFAPAGAVGTAKMALRTVTGALGPAGTEARDTAKRLAGALTSAGLVGRRTGRALAGALGPAGAAAKSVVKGLAGAFAPAGATGAVKTALRMVVGSFGATGALTRDMAKELAGAVPSLGTVGRRSARGLAGALGPAGAVCTAKMALRAVVGSFSAAGAVARHAARGLAGAVEPVGTVARRTARGLAGALGAAGVVGTAKTALRMVVGSFSAAGAVARRTARAMAGAVEPVGALARHVSRALAGAFAQAGVVGTAKTALRTVVGSFSAAGTVARHAARGLAGAVELVGAVGRRTARTLAGALGAASVVARRTGRALGGALTTTGAVDTAKTMVRTVGGWFGAAGAVARRTARGLAGAVEPVGAVARHTARALAGALGAGGRVARQMARALAGAVEPAGAMARRTGKRLAGALRWAGAAGALKVGFVLAERASRFVVATRNQAFDLATRMRKG